MKDQLNWHAHEQVVVLGVFFFHLGYEEPFCIFRAESQSLLPPLWEQVTQAGRWTGELLVGLQAPGL